MSQASSIHRDDMKYIHYREHIFSVTYNVMRGFSLESFLLTTSNIHQNDTIWAWRHLKSSADRLFVELIVQADNIKVSKLHITDLLWGVYGKPVDSHHESQ